MDTFIGCGSHEIDAVPLHVDGDGGEGTDRINNGDNAHIVAHPPNLGYGVEQTGGSLVIDGSKVGETTALQALLELIEVYGLIG